MLEIEIDGNDSISKAGSMLGPDAVIVMDETMSCRGGTSWLYEIVHRIEHGQGCPEDLDLLRDLTANIMGRTVCALGDAASMPVQGFLKHFRDEFLYHIENGRCLVPKEVQRVGSGFRVEMGK
jgi:NADH-quinone oxidoreductase subunit F